MAKRKGRLARFDRMVREHKDPLREGEITLFGEKIPFSVTLGGLTHAARAGYNPAAALQRLSMRQARQLRAFYQHFDEATRKRIIAALAENPGRVAMDVVREVLLGTEAKPDDKPAAEAAPAIDDSHEETATDKFTVGEHTGGGLYPILRDGEPFTEPGESAACKVEGHEKALAHAAVLNAKVAETKRRMEMFFRDIDVLAPFADAMASDQTVQMMEDRHALLMAGLWQADPEVTRAEIESVFEAWGVLEDVWREAEPAVLAYLNATLPVEESVNGDVSQEEAEEAVRQLIEATDEEGNPT